MARIRVVTDSTADMDEAEASRLNVSLVPLNVHMNGDTYRDKVDLSIDEFYRRLREGKVTPRTSQPSVGQFVEEYRRLLQEADGIVSVHISSKISGTCNAARMAAQAVAPDKIAILDSYNLSYALGSLALRVAAVADAGGTLEECVAEGQRIVPRLRLFAAADTLEYLRRGGRLSRTQALAGTILSIKPMVHLVDGEILLADRVRTRAAAVKRMAEMVLALGRLEEAALLYADNPEPADQMEAIIRAAYPDLVLKRGRTGAVVGSHNGPGLFGAYALLPE